MNSKPAVHRFNPRPLRINAGRRKHDTPSTGAVSRARAKRPVPDTGSAIVQDAHDPAYVSSDVHFADNNTPGQSSRGTPSIVYWDGIPADDVMVWGRWQEQIRNKQLPLEPGHDTEIGRRCRDSLLYYTRNVAAQLAAAATGAQLAAATGVSRDDGNAHLAATSMSQDHGNAQLTATGAQLATTGAQLAATNMSQDHGNAQLAATGAQLAATSVSQDHATGVSRDDGNAQFAATTADDRSNAAMLIAFAQEFV